MIFNIVGFFSKEELTMFMPFYDRLKEYDISLSNL